MLSIDGMNARTPKGVVDVQHSIPRNMKAFIDYKHGA